MPLDNTNEQLAKGITPPSKFRDSIVDRMMAIINGTGAPEIHRQGHMSRKRAENTIDLLKAAWRRPMGTDEINNQKMAKNVTYTSDDLNKMIDAGEDLQKSVTLSTGLTYYDLRAPALNLFPTVTPLRNSLPRNQRQYPGDSLHWKSVDSTVGSGYPYMGWVPEGKRSASMSYVTSEHTMPYKTLGEEDSITEEARFAAMGFEDEDALVQLRLLLKMFVKEEAALLAGNNSLTLATPATPTLSVAGTGNTLPSATYSVIVVALTPEGYLNSNTAVGGGVATALTITGNDGQTYTLNGGSSMKSAAATQAVTLGEYLNCNTNTQVGAVAYAWYIGLAGAEKLEFITTINSLRVTGPLAGTGQAATAIASDHSKNTTAFDGLLITTFAASNSYLSAFATGTPGTGTGMTSSGRGSIVQIDTMLKSMWDNNRISPTVMYVNSQELQNMSDKVLNGTSAPLLRYNSDAQGAAEYKLTASGVIAFYYNPFTPDGGVKMPVKVHPNIMPGTLMARSEILPPWYVSNNVPEVAVVQTRQDYYAEVWPKTTRVQFYGVYSQEVLAVYTTFAAGILYNIGNI